MDLHDGRIGMTDERQMQQPLVSVVVPVYNAEEYLAECLDSIVAQTYPNLEVIVADDASTDGSAEIAESYGAPVRVLRRDENLGQFPNLEDALGRVQGEFVCVFHADDVYHPDIVEREATFLRDHPEVGMVLSMDLSIDGEGRVYGSIDLPRGVEPRRPMDHREVLRWLMIHKNTFLRTPSAMIRKSVFDEVGPFREGRFSHAADLDMWLRVARVRRLAILDEHLFGYRHTPDSMAHSYQRGRREIDVFFRIVETHLEETGYDPPEEARAAFRAHRAEDRLLLAAGDYVRGDRAAMRERLTDVGLGDLTGSEVVQRPRMIVLYVLLETVSRLPWLSLVAAVFRRRWWPDATSSSDLLPT
jgi:glycosyltransferase involved in cell wall biosynthesis